MYLEWRARDPWTLVLALDSTGEDRPVRLAEPSYLHAHLRLERCTRGVVKPGSGKRQDALTIDRERTLRTGPGERAGDGTAYGHFVRLNLTSEKDAIRLNAPFDSNLHPVCE
jgi:hypothetical protein